MCKGKILGKFLYGCFALGFFLVLLDFAYSHSPKSGYLMLIKTFEARFWQVTYQGSQKIIYEGSLVAKKPNQARWKYEKPIKKEIYLKDNQVTIYEPTLFQVTLSEIKDGIDFFSILKHASLESRDPKNPKNKTYVAQIDSTLYTLQTKEDIPYKIHFKDAFNHVIEIFFMDVKINENVSDEIFEFKIPDDVDVVRN